ncbi:MAG TPA: PH domain-containing protein [Candidatus Saccharimonadales bacterium]|nr:PH domain-containing protein [Candidatus Saccharimonadales bacterium]
MRYDPERKYRNIVKVVLAPNEHVVLGARQSYLETISPGIMLITNKRILIIKLSFWGLHFGHNLMRSSLFINLHYNKITETSLLNGRILCSIIIKILGGGERRFDGLRRKEATRLIGFLERIIVANEDEAK